MLAVVKRNLFLGGSLFFPLVVTDKVAAPFDNHRADFVVEQWLQHLAQKRNVLEEKLTLQ